MKSVVANLGSRGRNPRALLRFVPTHPRRALDQVQGEYLVWILKEALAGGCRSLLDAR